MSVYKLTNKSGGQLVCDLAVQGKTLRLDNKKSQTIKENEITPHIKNLVSRGLILSEEVVQPQQTKKNTTPKSSKVKEE